MKLKLNETVEESQARLEKRTKKQSFDNGKGLTKIEQFMILDVIDFIQHLLDSESPIYPAT